MYTHVAPPVQWKVHRKCECGVEWPLDRQQVLAVVVTAYQPSHAHNHHMQPTMHSHYKMHDTHLQHLRLWGDIINN